MSTRTCISIVAFLACLVIAGTAAAVVAKAPPGAAAPTQLVGTWRHTITQAQLRSIKIPTTKRTWVLVVTNAAYTKAFPLAVGIGPSDERRDSVPFGVAGGRLHLTCLADDGQPTVGYATFAWTVRAAGLTLKQLSNPCRDPFFKDELRLLGFGTWRKGGRS